MATQDLHAVYNFFEKIQKPPEQDSFEDGMIYVYEYVRRQPSFLLGQLHKNLDANGVYPYVNHPAFCNGDFHAFKDERPPAEWLKVSGKGLGPLGGLTFYPGGYAEMATSSGEPLCPKPPKENSCYLLVAYKDSEVGESNFAAFEGDWKAKAGVNILSESFPADIHQGEFAFYKLRTANPSPFMYVLRCEILPGSSTESVLAFLPTLRTKLTEGGIPFSDVSAYEVVYVCQPIKE